MSEHTKYDCVTCPVCGVESAGSLYFSEKKTMQAEITRLKDANNDLVEALNYLHAYMDNYRESPNTPIFDVIEHPITYIEQALAKAKGME